MGFKFEKLTVWQIAIELSYQVSLLIDDFPNHEKFILASQIQRAADSVALNIAEGSTGQTNPDFKRFLNYWIRSALEVVSCLHLGRKRKIISERNFESLYNQYEELIKKIQALKNSLK
ncbi:four helix bundle protein [Belliella buryatensis]|uniref:Four helix bundle protein n=1 Tax=Belliella buryatensis TaxID=1500549 RepID=A0A239GT18_9BACT|nr:four helix bundle protein [Belliella buryatensis]SNS72369.1 four helix bundle protein [Belliella buryatensis]